ncbi:MAG: DUF460 domain-containing protein [Nanoarchaeota archaeon]
MSDTELLILGLDPGTTVGCCLLDLEGKAKARWSRKEYPLHEIIKDVSAQGRVIAVGTDKKKMPKLVRIAATKLGCRAISPKEDLLLADKKHVGSGKNAHEIDAHAAALVAFSELRGLIKKAELASRHVEHVSRESLLRFILHEPQVNIKRAIDILTSPVEKDVLEVKRTLQEKAFTEKNFVKMLSRLQRALREEQLLKKRVLSLEGEQKSAQRKEKKVKKPDIDEQLSFKEERILAFERRIGVMEAQKKEMENELGKLHRLLSLAGEYTIAKKMRNLGREEFERKRELLSLRQGDVLVVDSCTEFSEHAMKQLKGVVVCSLSKVPANLRGKVHVISKNPVLEESRHFALVDRKVLEKELGKGTMLQDIISDYRDGRQTR